MSNSNDFQYAVGQLPMHFARKLKFLYQASVYAGLLAIYLFLSLTKTINSYKGIFFAWLFMMRYVLFLASWLQLLKACLHNKLLLLLFNAFFLHVSTYTTPLERSKSSTGQQSKYNFKAGCTKALFQVTSFHQHASTRSILFYLLQGLLLHAYHTNKTVLISVVPSAKY